MRRRPPANDALDQARAAYRVAQADPKVSQHAPAELDIAARALREAERAPADERARRAYLAEQRSRIALELASARARALAQARGLQAQVAELEASKTERGWILTLGADLLFDVGQATIKPGGRRAIANVAGFMRQHGERKIVIEGFTDDSGSPQANQRLSERRAQAVRQALVREGIDAERVVARGLGAAYPVASNSNPGGRQLNRRVEILIGEGIGRAATGGRR